MIKERLRPMITFNPVRLAEITMEMKESLVLS